MELAAVLTNAVWVSLDKHEPDVPPKPQYEHLVAEAPVKPHEVQEMVVVGAWMAANRLNLGMNLGIDETPHFQHSALASPLGFLCRIRLLVSKSNHVLVPKCQFREFPHCVRKNRLGRRESWPSFQRTFGGNGWRCSSIRRISNRQCQLRSAAA